MFGCWRFAIPLLVATTVMTGCSMAVFESNLNPREGGLAYYLPKSLVTVKVTAVGYGRGTVVKELSIEENLTAIAEGAVKVRARFGGVTRNVLVDAGGKLVREQLVSLKLHPVSDEKVADLEYNYILQYQPRIDYADRVCAGVTEDSLLRYVEAATKDETGNIIVSLGKLAGRVAGPGAFADTGGAVPLSRSLKMKLDPFSHDDIDDFNRAIKARFPELPGRFKLHVEGTEKFGEAHSPAACPQDKICYRTLVPVRIGLSRNSRKIVALQYVEVINRASVHTIDVTRAFLVEKLTRLGFREGVLDYAVIKKPSEALSAAKLPLTVYDAVLTSALAAPGRFLGEITPGISAADALKILQDQDAAVTATAQLQAQLEMLRNDGNRETVPTEDEDKLRLRCGRGTPPT